MKFEKYHGIGNDFIIFNNLDEHIKKEEMSGLAKKLCHRNFGIGADGLIGVKKVDGKYFMDYYNSDGSFAEMCGNGVRCTAHYIIKNIEKTQLDSLIIKTGDGDKAIEVFYEENALKSFRVNMGLPKFLEEITVEKENLKVLGCKVSMGNPHFVMFTDDLSDKTVWNNGAILETSTEYFENKTNVEFAQIINKSNIKLRVWERGCGETLACGTGASATVVAGIVKKILDTKVEVSLLGGKLTIEWNGNFDDCLYLQGPAEFVFGGEISL